MKKNYTNTQVLSSNHITTSGKAMVRTLAKPLFGLEKSKRYVFGVMCLLVLVGASPLTLQAQPYIKCATNFFGGDNTLSNSTNGEAQVVNGVTYMVWNMQEGTNDLLGGSATPHSGGDHDIYISVVDANCVQTIGTYSGGSGLDLAEDIIVNADGSFLVSGITNSPDFPTTDGTSVAGVGSNYFIQKYAADGSLIFSTIFEGIRDDGEVEMISDGSSTYLSIETRATMADLAAFTTDGTDGGGGTTNMLVVKLDATGSVVYASSVGGSNDEEFMIDYITDLGGRDGNMLLLNGCLFVQAASGSPDFPTTDGGTSLGQATYLLKYDPTGNLAFSTIIDTRVDGFPNDLGAVSVATDGTSIYTLGIVGNFEPAIVSKFDASGNLIFQKVIPGLNGASTLIYQNGALYIGGDTQNDSAFQATMGPGDGGIGIVKLDASTGDVVYAITLTGRAVNSSIAVNATGEVFVQGSEVFGNAETTDGTSGEDYYLAKLDADGNVTTATLLDVFTDFPSNTLLSSLYVEDNVLTYVASPQGNIPVTDNSSSDYGDQNYWLVKMDFCPEPPTIPSATLTPATQVACINGVLDQILGEPHFFDGTLCPEIIINGVSSPQPNAELEYQWQYSFTGTDPWTDVGGAVGRQQNYTPPPGAIDIHYRRLTVTSPCCGEEVISTSSTVFIDIDDTMTAPEVQTGAPFYTCPGETITIGSPPNSATGGTPPYTYLWSTGETTATIDVTSTQSAIYTLTVIDALGCEQVDQASVDIYTAEAGDPKFVCDGTPVVIGGPAIPGLAIGVPVLGEAGVTYSWAPAVGLSDSNIPNPEATAGGTYILTVTIYQADGSFCATMDDVVIGVANAPSNPNFAGADMVLCLGEEAVLGTPGEVLSISDVSTSTVTQSTTDGGTATAASLTDGDFATGGHTNDGSNENITIDFGSTQTANTIQVAALNGFTNDDRLRVEYSLDDVTYTNAAFYFAGVSSSSLTTIQLTSPIIFQYLRLRSSSSTRDVSISEVGVSNEFRYIWTPGEFISATNIAQPTFNAGNVSMPDPNPYVYTATANIGDCNYYDQVSVYIIEARAGVDGCGPRVIGEPDRTPNTDETYSWRIIPELSDGDNSNFTGPTDQLLTTVSGNDAGATHYELTTSFVLDGDTFTCRDTVIVPPCGCFVDIEVKGGGCPDFDSNISDTLTATAFFLPDNFQGDPNDLLYTWTPMEGLNTYTGQEVIMQDNVGRTYTVTVSSISDPSYECSGTILVNNPDFATPSFLAAGDLSGCPGDMVMIGDPANNPGLSYSWMPTDGLDDPTISNPTLTLSEDETYTVVVTDIVTGCIIRDTVQVAVGGQQGLAGPDLYICDNATVTIGANTGLPGYNYSWTPIGSDWRDDTNMPDPSQVSEAMPNVFVSTIGGAASSQTFTLTAESPDGCFTVDEVTVFVSPIPPTATLTDVTYCPSVTPVILGWTNSDGTGTNQVPNPDPNYSYEWSPANLLVDATVQNPTLLTPLPTTPVTFELKLLGGGGCNSIASQTITPSISVPAAVGSPVAICVNESIQIGSSTNVGGTYLWTADAGNPAGGSLDDGTVGNPAFTSTATGEFTYTVTKTEGGCMSTAEVTIVVQDVDVPTVPSVSLCQGETGVVIGPDPEAGLTYSWVPSTDLSDPNIAQPTFTGTATQNYTLYVFNGIGCSASTLVRVTVGDEPAPEVNVDDIMACFTTSSEVVLDASVTPAGNYSYQWSSTDFLSNPSIEDPTFFIPGTGSYTYSLLVTNQDNGCQTREEVMITASALSEPITLNDPDDACVDGSDMNFTATPAPAAGATGVFSTTAGTGLTDNGDGTASLDVSTAGVGTYDVTYTYTNADGCEGMQTVSVTIDPVTTVSLNDPADVCTDGTDLAFTGMPTDANGVFTTTATTGLTDNGDGTASLDISVAGAGTYDVTYTYTDGNGCMAAQTVSVEVFSAIEVTVAEPSTICSPQGIDLTQGASILPADLGGTWTSSGNGTFTTGAVFGTATTYFAGSEDLRAGQVTLTLTTNDSGVCGTTSASVTFQVSAVDCGTFPWSGN